MKRTNYFKSLLLCLILVSNVVFAQTEQDKVIFKAMEDELSRNMKELNVDNKSPFFMEYVVMQSKYGQIKGSLGALQNSFFVPVENKAGARIMLGDYKTSSDFNFLPNLYIASMPEELDYDNIRTSFWKLSDVTYKSVIKNYDNKLIYVKTNPEESERTFSDFIKLPEFTNTIIENTSYDYDKKQWEATVKELSLIFENYPKLFGTSVQVDFIEQLFWKKTSEGTTLRYPQTYVCLSVVASLKNVNNSVVNDQYFIHANNPSQLPSIDVIKKEISEFADQLLEFYDPVIIEDGYVGPVMFEEDALYEAVRFNTAADWALLAYRQPLGNGTPMPMLDSKLNQKIIDERFTVKSFNSLRDYKGEPVYGYYDVDAEGVKPTDGTVLVENGIFKRKLNDRTSDAITHVTTGSCRFSLRVDGIGQVVAPGIIHLTSNKNTKHSKMKQKLIAAAKKEGLDYAYIYRCTSRVKYAQHLYRVDVKTGKEELIGMNSECPYALILGSDNVLAVSDQEVVSNQTYRRLTMSTFIYPKSIILDNVRIKSRPVINRAADAI